jgi:hypothetical protein
MIRIRTRDLIHFLREEREVYDSRLIGIRRLLLNLWTRPTTTMCSPFVLCLDEGRERERCEGIN